jgi:hypothetical protein
MTISALTRFSKSSFAAAALALFFLFAPSPCAMAQGNDGRVAAPSNAPADSKPAAVPERQADPVEIAVGLLVIAIISIALVGTPTLMVAVAFALGRWSARGEARAAIAASRCAPQWSQPVVRFNPFEQQPSRHIAYDPHQPEVVNPMSDTARLQPPPARENTLRFSSVAS